MLLDNFRKNIKKIKRWNKQQYGTIWLHFFGTFYLLILLVCSYDIDMLKYLLWNDIYTSICIAQKCKNELLFT